MKLAAIILLAGSLAVASAALPNHPFFTGAQLAGTSSADGYKEYQEYDSYDTQRLCLQGKSVCFTESGPPFDFILGLDCCKDSRYHHEEALLDLTNNQAGWCLFNQDLVFIPVPNAQTGIASTFTAQCYLHSTAPECQLEQCENAVVQVEGVVVFDDIVYETQPFLLDNTGCNIPKGRKDVTMTQTKWAQEMLKRSGREPNTASTKRLAPGSGETLWEAYGTLWYGIATTYDSHGKILGTGTFNYNVPFGPGTQITPAQAAGRKRYFPQQIKTGINSIKAGEHYQN